MRRNTERFRKIKVKILTAVFLVCAIVPLLNGMVYATYTQNNNNSPANLLFMELYYNALTWCAGNSNISYTADAVSLSFNGDNRSKLLADLNLEGEIFNQKKLLYSDIIEYDYGKSGHDDGKVWCSELNSKKNMLKTVMYAAGVENKDVFCALYNIEAGYKGTYVNSGNVPEGWPSNLKPDGTSNCSAQYDALKDALVNDRLVATQGTGARSESFYVKIRPNDKTYRQQALANVLGAGLGNFANDNTLVEQNKQYQLYYYTFKYGCGVDLNSSYDTEYSRENPPQSMYANSYLALPDQRGVIHYYKKDIFGNTKIYLNDGSELTNSKTKTCSVAASDLANKVSESPDSWAQAAQYSTMDECVSRYNNALVQLEENHTAENAAKNRAGTMVKVLRSVVDGLSKNRSFTIIPFSVNPSTAVSDFKIYMENSYNQVAAGAEVVNTISGKTEKIEVFSESIAKAMLEWSNTIADSIDRVEQVPASTEVRVILKSGVSEDNFNVILANAGVILKQADNELERVGNALDNIKSEIDSMKSQASSKPSSELEGVAWGMNNGVVECKTPTVNDIEGGVTVDTTEIQPIYADGSANPSSGSNRNNFGSLSEVCYNSGIEGMTWILCPGMNNMEHTVTALEGTIRSWLTVDTNLYDNDSSTKIVWNYMRDIANIIIIIILLVVVFSQLTGYGIDNYGIKKILPKLVMMAVAINLSFYICELLIDLSNIFGMGLDNMFAGIGENILAGSEWTFEMLAEGFLANAMTAVLAIAGGAGFAAGTIVTVASIAISGMTPMAIIMIVLAVAVVIVAVLLFFLMLGARMVIIVFCMAVSPIALACYILPNTQKITKKWLDLFKAALLIFPICGAVSGISYIIKAIVVTTEGVHIWMWMVAIVVPYLPFFMLPTLLRGAINGLGVIGGALILMGNGLRNGVRRGEDTIKQTETYKSEQERQNRVNNARRTGFQFDRSTGEIRRGVDGKPLNRRMNRLQRFMAGGEIGMARAREQAAKIDDTRDSERNMMANGNIFATQRTKDENKQTEKVQEATVGVARMTDAYARQQAENKRITEEEKIGEGAEVVSRDYARRVARNARLEQQAKIDENVAETNYDYARQMASNERRMQQAKIDEGAPVVSDRYARRTAENARVNEQAKIDNVAPRVTQEYANQMAANDAMREAAKIKAGAPVFRWDTVGTMAENEVRMTNAQQRAGVAAINDAIAQSRAEATRDAQEYKLTYEQVVDKDKGVRQAELGRALVDASAGAGARIRATFDSLSKTGDWAEILTELRSFNPATATTEQINAVTQVAAASGTPWLKGWAKELAKGNLAKGLDAYAADPTSGLIKYIQDNAGDHALDTAHKDILTGLANVLASNPGAAKVFSPAVIKNAAVTAANQNAVSKQAVVDMIRAMKSAGGNMGALGNQFSASDLTKMSLEVARELGSTVLGKAITELNQPGNDTIRANIPADVKAALGIK